MDRHPNFPDRLVRPAGSGFPLQRTDHLNLEFVLDSEMDQRPNPNHKRERESKLAGNPKSSHLLTKAYHQNKIWTVFRALGFQKCFRAASSTPTMHSPAVDSCRPSSPSPLIINLLHQQELVISLWLLFSFSYNFCLIRQNSGELINHSSLNCWVSYNLVIKEKEI